MGTGGGQWRMAVRVAAAAMRKGAFVICPVAAVGG